MIFLVLIGSLDNRLLDDMGISGVCGWQTSDIKWKLVFYIQLFSGAGFIGSPGLPKFTFWTELKRIYETV